MPETKTPEYVNERQGPGQKNDTDTNLRGRSVYRLVAVSFGLLCIVQAALNILLHLYVYKNTYNLEDRLKNVTGERDELKRKLIDVEERDELHRKLIDFDKCLRWNYTSYQTCSQLDSQGSRHCLFTHNYTQSGWQYFEGSVYYVSPSTQKTWNQSREDCLQRGADLIIIDSREEQNFTRQLKDDMWIGLTEKDGMWNWVDGTPLTTSYWMNDEPNNYEYREEGCAEVRFHKEENSWNDEPCSYDQYWICEKKVPL